MRYNRDLFLMLGLLLLLFYVSITLAISGSNAASDDSAAEIEKMTAEVTNALAQAENVGGTKSKDEPESKKNENPGIMPVNSKTGGMSYGEWNAEWWKWALSIPYDSEHPLFDDSPPEDSDSNEMLPGKVLFLGSSFTSEEEDGQLITRVNREIAIKPGTRIFIPIFNGEASVLEGNGETEEELQSVSDSWLEDVVIGSVQIDGVQVENPEQYKSPSGGFTFGPLPEDNVLEEAYGLENTEGKESLSAANGYYLMLPPLSAGEHKIQFTAVYGGAWTQDVTYDINVEPDRGNSKGEDDSQDIVGGDEEGIDADGL